MHISDAAPVEPRRPLWKRFRQADLFVDQSFARFLTCLCEEVDDRIELIFNGDAFDFDPITAIPENPSFPVSWLERQRGLVSEEEKSEFKVRRVLRDHPVWVEALRDFLQRGNDVVFVIGNHDLELHWPAVQRTIRDALDPDRISPSRRNRWRTEETLDAIDQIVNILDPDPNNVDVWHLLWEMARLFQVQQ